MRKVLFTILFSLFLLVSISVSTFSCGTIQQSPRDSEIYRSTSTETKVITAKDAPIESRIGLFTWNKTKTIYYFYAKDGTWIEVDRATYHQYQVGDRFSGKWKE